MLFEKIKTKILGDYELDADLYLPDGKKQFPAVLLCHGFLSAKEEFGDFPAKLAEQGYVVLAFDFRGHGKSKGERGYYTLASHIDDASKALDFLLSQVKVIQDRVAVIGHSLGSVATSRLVTENSKGREAKTCILMSPPRKFADSINSLERNAYKMLSQIAWPFLLLTGNHFYLPYQFSAKDIFLSPEAIKTAESLGFLQNKMPVNNYQYMITQIDHESFASKIEMPTLVLAAKNDKLIPNKSSKAVFDAVKCSDKKYLEIENTGHSMMTDYSAEQVKDEVLNWLKEKL